MSDLSRLDNAMQAFLDASTDHEFVFFKVYTRPLFDPMTGETGQFTQEFTHSLIALDLVPDPAGYLKLAARLTVAYLTQSKRVPVEKVIVEFSPIMEKYGVPSHLFLDTARDRAWLV